MNYDSSPAHAVGPDLWNQVVAAPAVREQQVAFTCATGVPLTLIPHSQHNQACEDGAFCVDGCLGDPSGVTCRRRLINAERRATAHSSPVQYCCPSGLVKILVPVIVDRQHVGSLLAGPFTMRSLDGPLLQKLVGRLQKLGLGGREEQLRTTWKFTPRLSSEKCRAAGTLLRLFGRYLAELMKQQAPLPASRRTSSSLLQRIEAFLAECQDSQVSLKEVAAKMSLSPCHFCAVFKKQTGITFSQYRTRRRLEAARTLLTEHDRRISDVAFEAGFGSIPYFNRAFRRLFGCSPSEYRVRHTKRNPGQENRNPGVAPIPGNRFND